MKMAQRVYVVFNPNGYLDTIFIDKESAMEYIKSKGVEAELYSWRMEIPCYWTEDGPEL